MRALGATRAQAGILFGLITIATGILGIGVRTSVADVLRAKDVVDGKFRIMASVCIVGALRALGMSAVSTTVTFMAATAGILSCCAAGIALAPSTLQEFAPNEIRGQALALYQLVAILFGAGLGPPAVALIAQKLPTLTHGLATSMAIVAACAFALGATGVCFGRGAFARGVLAGGDIGR